MVRLVLTRSQPGPGMSQASRDPMKFVLFCHPDFMQSESMPKFANMIGEAMQTKGHEVAYWAPRGRIFRLFDGARWKTWSRLAKWGGYLDQYLIFPLQVRLRLPWQSRNTLFVFCDQALGPWVPLVQHRPHVVHAHDLLALRSALGLIPQNPTSRSGQLYQRYIRRGFQQARHFISVSKRTQDDLTEFGQVRPETAHVVHNGLNHSYHRVDPLLARTRLQSAGLPVPEEGMLLHVGGSAWYKNTVGIIELYGAYARRHARPLPLWMISPTQSKPDVQAALAKLPPQAQVHFFRGLNNDTLEAAYSLAKAFIFPSLAEGFGWPLVEAHACGCPVLTTDDAPMNEIAGPLAHYLPLREGEDVDGVWATQGANALDAMLQVPGERQEELIAQRMQWAAQFTTERAIEAYYAIYRSVIDAASAKKG